MSKDPSKKRDSNTGEWRARTGLQNRLDTGQLRALDGVSGVDELRSEERRVGKSVGLGGGRRLRKKGRRRRDGTQSGESDRDDRDLDHVTDGSAEAIVGAAQ